MLFPIRFSIVSLTLLFVLNVPAYATDEPPTESGGCQRYPIVLPYALLEQTTEGAFLDMPHGEDVSSFDWLSWDGSDGEYSIASSLLNASLVSNYENPEDFSDSSLEVGDFLYTANRE